MELRLLRTDITADGVFGRLLTPGHIPLYTCEDDYQATRGASCIPAGTYTLKRTIYLKHGLPTYEVTGVPGRSRILIHPGNTEEDTLGCILLGLQRGEIVVPVDEDTGRPQVSKRAVTGSRVAFKMWMQWMEGIDQIPLAVQWMPGLLPTLPPVA